jgi:hypothetical protein
MPSNFCWAAIGYQNICPIHWRGFYRLPQRALATGADVPTFLDPALPTAGATAALSWVTIRHHRCSLCEGYDLNHAKKDSVHTGTFFLSTLQLLKQLTHLRFPSDRLSNEQRLGMAQSPHYPKEPE